MNIALRKAGHGALSVLASCSSGDWPIPQIATAAPRVSMKSTAYEPRYETAALLDDFRQLCRSSKVSRMFIEQNNIVLLNEEIDPRAKARLDIMSVSKAVSGLVFARLMHDKDIQLLTLLNHWSSMTPHFSHKVNLGHIFSHSSCLRLQEDDEVGRVYAAHNLHDLNREARLVCTPGHVCQYSNFAVNILGLILREETGESLKSYAERVIFKPMEMENIEWEGDEMGNNYVMAGLHLTMDEMAKMGRLLFSRGQYRRKQIIPESWIDYLWQAGEMMPEQAIGGRVSWRGLWAQTYFDKPLLDAVSGLPREPPDILSANGFGGQYIIALRRSQTLIITQRDTELDGEPPQLGGVRFLNLLKQIDHAGSVNPMATNVKAP